MRSQLMCGNKSLGSLNKLALMLALAAMALGMTSGAFAGDTPSAGLKLVDGALVDPAGKKYTTEEAQALAPLTEAEESATRRERFKRICEQAGLSLSPGKNAKALCGGTNPADDGPSFVYWGNGSTESWFAEELSETLQMLGEPATSSDTFPTTLSDYGTIFLFTPVDAFEEEDAADLLSFVEGGGTLVAIGEHYGWEETNTTINELSLALGSSITIFTDSIDGGCGSITDRIVSHELTAGVTSIKMAATSRVGPGDGASVLVRTASGSQPMISVQQIGAGYYVVSADLNLYVDNENEGCELIDGNYQFIQNLAGGGSASSGYGQIETAGTGDDLLSVVKVGGTRYQMGYWYGRLLAQQIVDCWTHFSAYAISEGMTMDVLDEAVESMFKAEYFDVDAYESEFRGIVDGCAEEGYTVVLQDLYRMHALPDVSELGCSLLAAWGTATSDGHLYQLRNLDWTMTGHVQDYPVVAIYEPSDGITHGVVGFAGMIGAIAGMNAEGIAQSQIMGHFCDEESLDGVPMPILLREVLYHDQSKTAALTRMQNATRTNEYHYGIGDGIDFSPSAELLLTSATRFDRYAGGQSVTDHPCEDLSPFHTALTDVVYWRGHNGGGNNLIYNALSPNLGNIDHNTVIAAAQAAGVSSTLMSVVYDATDLQFWVAFAQGTSQPAHTRTYVNVPLERGFGECVDLTMSAEGSGTTDPAEGVTSYEVGSLVAVSASHAYSYVFDHWEGDLSGSENPAYVLMDDHKDITAVFRTATLYELTTSAVGSGTLSPTAGVAEYYEGETITLTATPEPGWALDHWEGHLAGSTDNPVSFTMPAADTSVSAVFLPVSLSVDQTSIPVPQAGGVVGFQVQNSGAGRMTWAVTESCDWVSLTPTVGEVTGVGSDPVVVSCLANMSCLPRTCTIMVTAPDATESPIAIELVQAANTEPSLVVTPTALAVGRDAGTSGFSILNGGCGSMFWAITESCDWISVSPSEGLATDAAEDVVVSFSANPTESERQCTLTVTAPGVTGSPVEIVITQAKGIPPALQVTPSDLIEVPPQGGTTSLIVKNSGGLTLNWAASATGSWVDVAPNAGTCVSQEEDTVTIAYSENTECHARTSTIVIMSPDVPGGVMTVPIRQRARYMPELYASPALLQVGSDEGVTSFSVENVGCRPLDWSISGPSSWASFTPGVGSCDVDVDTVTITYNENTDDESRSTTFTITSPDAEGSPIRVVLTQAAKGIPVLDVSPTSINLDYTGGLESIAVDNSGTGELTWTASIITGGDWLTIDSGATGTADGFVNFTCAENLTGTVRNGLIRISSPEAWNGPVDVTIVQFEEGAVIPDDSACESPVKRLQTDVAEEYLPRGLQAQPGGVIAPDASFAVMLSADGPVVAESVWAVLEMDDGTLTGGGAWRPVSADDAKTGWVLFTPSSPLPEGGSVTLTVGAMTEDGAEVPEIAEQYLVGSADMAKAEDTEPQLVESAGLEPLPEVLAASSAAMYRIVPEGVFDEPITVLIPVPEGTVAEDLDIYYFSESQLHYGWYPAANVSTWLVPGSRTTRVDEDGQTYLEVQVNHSGVLQLARTAEVELGGIGAIEVGLAGSKQRLMLLIGVLVVLGVALVATAVRRSKAGSSLE